MFQYIETDFSGTLLVKSISLRKKDFMGKFTRFVYSDLPLMNYDVLHSMNCPDLRRGIHLSEGALNVISRCGHPNLFSDV